jgi:hypothetical protein
MHFTIGLIIDEACIAYFAVVGRGSTKSDASANHGFGGPWQYDEACIAYFVKYFTK